MSTTTTTPCRVPPAGDASPEIARRYYATPALRYEEAITVGEKVALDHLLGRLHFGPLCRLCGGTA